jgi:hypothetical protein
MFSTKDGNVTSLRAVNKDQNYVQVYRYVQDTWRLNHTHTTVTKSRTGKFVTVHFTTAYCGMTV